MVQSTLRQARRASSCKSSIPDAALPTHIRGGRGKHGRARSVDASDSILYQVDAAVSDSRGCVEDSLRMVRKTGQKAATGDPQSRPRAQTQKSQRTSSAKTTVREPGKSDTRTHLQLRRKVDYIEKATVLLDWIIKPLPDIRGVCVEGQKQGMDDYWHSAAIVEAVRPTVVVTATGSVYRLEGKINKYCTIDNGFSKEVASAFSWGFPRNWSQVIQDFYRQLEDSISIIAEISPVKGKKPRQSPKMAVAMRKRKAQTVSHHKLQAQDHNHDSIWTPAGLVKQKLSTNDVTVTRSGRVSLPPLAHWTGQFYRRIPNSNDIEVTFETDCAKKTHCHATTQLLKLPKRSLKMFYNTSLSTNCHLHPGSRTKLPDSRLNQSISDFRLNQTINRRKKNDEGSPPATGEGSRKESAEALFAGRKFKSKKSPDKLIIGRTTSLKVNAFLESADEDTRRGISHTVKQSVQGIAAVTGTNVTSVSSKDNRSHNFQGTSQLSPAETGPDVALETSRQPARHSRGLLTKDGTDVHTGIILRKSLRVVLSRNLPSDDNSRPMNTNPQRAAKMPVRFLDTEQDSRSERISDQRALRSSSNVDTNSAFLQPTDSSETRLSMSYSKCGREAQANPRLQAEISDSESGEPNDSSSTDVQDRNFQTQTAAAKARRKKTDKKKSPAGWSSDESDHKSDGKLLPKPRRGGLITDMESRAVSEASLAKSHHMSTSSKSAAGGVHLLPPTDLTGPPVAGKGKPFSAGKGKLFSAGKGKPVSGDKGKPVSAGKNKPTTRKRKREADDEAAGDHTMVEKKPRKRSQTMDVMPSVDVPWNQQEKDLLHRALKDVNGADPSYWEKVAAIVGTRSQAECQGFYRQSLEGKVTDKPRKCTSHKQNTGRRKGEPIRGGKGTLKRKQEVRAFVQEQNEGYEDNLFEGTPFIKRHQQSSLFTVNVEKSDSQIFGANHNCITPVAGTSAISTPGTVLRAKMVSVKKTPQSDSVSALDYTPVSFNRRKADQYIKSFIDRQRKAEPGPVAVQNDSSMSSLSNLPVRSLFSPSTHPGTVIDSHSANPEEEGDQDEEDRSPYMYYWNDEN
ncbi:hypothetical protein BsWGS_09844 [Bradybaena similaris]